MIPLVKSSKVQWKSNDYVDLTSPTLDECRDVMREVKQKGTKELLLRDSNHSILEEIITNMDRSSVTCINLWTSILDTSLLSSALISKSSLKNLTVLRINSCHLTSRDINLLCIALNQHSTLQALNVSHNPTIGDEGARCVAEMLKMNKVLQRVILTNCSITDNGIMMLSDALIVNQTLMVLSVSSNYGITLLGAHFLSNMLLINTSLRELWLYGTNISEDGATKLCKTLNQNNSVALWLPTHLQRHCEQFHLYDTNNRLPVFFPNQEPTFSY